MPEGWVQLQSSHNSRVWKFSEDGRVFIFKAFLDRGPLEGVKRIIRGSRAQRAWNGGAMLAERGFLTPPVLAWGVKAASGGQTTSNFLVTGFIPGAWGLFTFLKERFNAPEGNNFPGIKRRLISAFGRTVGRLHRSGIIHGDLRLNNIMVRNPEGGEPEFYFIDNERNMLFKKAPFKLVIKNLVQVNMVNLPCVGRKDRMGFLSAYLKEFPEIAPFKKELAKRVWNVTEERMRKKHGGLMVW